MTSKLQYIKDKCVEANPNLSIKHGKMFRDGKMWSSETPIRLADVLVAIHKQARDYYKNIPAEAQYYYEMKGRRLLFDWDTLDNNLENQSEECIDFIANVLGYEKSKRKV
jgi:hypothetical protein